MNILFGALCLLAIGAWLSYAWRQRSVLHMLGALICGAVLGIAAIIALSLIVDAAPERFAEPLGIVFSILVVGLLFSAVVRLLAALFSPASRASLAAHEVGHAVWFGAAIIIVGLAFLAKHTVRSRLDSPNRWVVLWSHLPRYQGRTMEEWLRVLRTDGSSTEHPLRVVRVIYSQEAEGDAVEVPLSWGLMQKYGLFELAPPYKGQREDELIGMHAKFYLFINGHGPETGLCWRATNGNCLLRYHHRLLNPGTNDIQVAFLMSFGDASREVTGPPAQVFAAAPALKAQP
jgi:MFS family permease